MCLTCWPGLPALKKWKCQQREHTRAVRTWRQRIFTGYPNLLHPSAACHAELAGDMQRIVHPPRSRYSVTWRPWIGPHLAILPLGPLSPRLQLSANSTVWPRIVYPPRNRYPVTWRPWFGTHSVSLPLGPLEPKAAVLSRELYTL